MSEAPSLRMAAVVLAAGGASRMGSPKQLLPFEGSSLVRRSAEAALVAGCRPVFVVIGAEADAVGEELAGLDVELVTNESWADGLASSIARGIAAARAAAADAVLLLLADQPHTTSTVLGRLLRAFDGAPATIVGSGYAGGVGAPALFGRDHFAELEALEGDRGARALLERQREQVQVVDFEAGAIDVDTPEDYEALRSEADDETDAGADVLRD